MATCHALAASPPTAGGASLSPPPRRTWLVDLFERARQSVVLVETIESSEAPATAPAVVPSPVPASQPGKPATQPGTRPATQPASSQPAPPPPPPAPRGGRTHWGTGFLIHRDGYFITCSHCFRFEGRRRAICPDGRTRDVAVIADDPEHDWALARVVTSRPMTPIKIGRSSDVMVGEQAITMGNPFGMGLTLSLGIVTALNRNTKTDYANLSGTIMTEAAANGGTSGGPLLNVNGEVIGMIASRKTDGDNLGFAVAADTIWGRLPQVLCEGRLPCATGLRVLVGPDEAKVESVAPGSAAQAAGVRPGDVVLHLAGQDIRCGVEAQLAMLSLRAGEESPLRVRRQGKPIDLKWTPRKIEPRPAEPAERKVQPALACEWFQGTWTTLPDFGPLKPAGQGTTPTIGLGPRGGKGPLALRLTGCIYAPREGMYTFWLKSNDGSRLQIGGATVVDNDGGGTRTAKGYVALRQGWHPLAVTYVDAGGEQSLTAYWETPGMPRREIPAWALGR